MLIRNMTADDYPIIRDMLIAEEEEPTAIQPYNTFVFDDDGIIGFFTLKMAHNLPEIWHFLVKKEKRSIKQSRTLIKACCDFVRRIYPIAIVAVKKDYLKKFTEYYFRKKPYAEKEGTSFYLVEV